METVYTKKGWSATLKVDQRCAPFDLLQLSYLQIIEGLAKFVVWKVAVWVKGTVSYNPCLVF